MRIRSKQRRRAMNGLQLERLEARLTPVVSSLTSGLWSLTLGANESLALQPDPSDPGQLRVIVNGAEVIEARVSATGVSRIEVRGSSGADAINLSALTVSLFSATPSVSIFGDAGNDTIQGAGGLATVVDGGDGNDSITGFSGDDTLNGGNGNDLLDGGNGNDVLRGLAGNDVLFGQDGDDILIGGAGRDSLFGGAGRDNIQGQGGNFDYAEGGAGADTISGGDGNDSLHGGADNDVLDGGQGDDTALGDEGDDLLLGADGNDSLVGALGRDVVIGGLGLDSVSGGDNEDIVMGSRSTLTTSQLIRVHQRWLADEAYRLRFGALTRSGERLTFISEVNVFDEGAQDEVSGGAGRDWLLLPIDGDTELDKATDRTRDEAVNTSIPIARSEVRPSGHGSAALQQLVPEDAATHRAIASGNWSNSTTWDTGTIPGTDAIVVIGEEFSVTIDAVFTERVAGIAVDGELRFATDRNTQLTVDTLVIHEHARFEMGTVENPIAAGVTATVLIADRGAIDKQRDVFQLGRGILAESTLSIHGATKTAFRTLQTGVGVGQTRLRLNGGVPADWNVGDQLVLAGTSSAANEDEQLTLLGIDGDAVIVPALTRAHLFPATTAPLSQTLHIHLANLTRNAVIRSESTELDRRGHVMLMHMDDVSIQYAAFNDLGRTDKKVPVNDVLFDANDQVIPGTGTNPRGRYSLHFHRAGVVNDGQAGLVRGTVVARSPGWGYTNHSSFVNFEDNVSYDVDGAGFATEAGNEMGSFVRNLAIRGHGSGEEYNARVNIHDFGHQGDGFWFQGPGIRVEDNAASGMEGTGLFMYSRGLVEWDKQNDALSYNLETTFLASNLEDPELAYNATSAIVSHVPVKHFTNNEAYGSTFGIIFSYVNFKTPATAAQTGRTGPDPVVRSVIENPVAWNNGLGIYVYQTLDTDIRGAVAIGRVNRPTGFGVKAHLGSANVTFENAHVEGWLYGITMPRRGVNLVQGGYFNNIDSIANFSTQQPQTFGTPNQITGMQNTIRDVTFGRLSATALRGAVQRNVVLTSWLQPTTLTFNGLFDPAIVTLDFGSFDNQRVYFALQNPGAVVFPTPIAGADPSLIGLTNQQLFDLTGKSFGDALTPDGTITSDQVFADVGTLTNRLNRLATSQPAAIGP